MQDVADTAPNDQPGILAMQAGAQTSTDDDTDDATRGEFRSSCELRLGGSMQWPALYGSRLPMRCNPWQGSGGPDIAQIHHMPAWISQPCPLQVDMHSTARESLRLSRFNATH